MPSASELIDARIKDLDDWRGQTLAKVRKRGRVESWGYISAQPYYLRR